jgi:hypothetical protein
VALDASALAKQALLQFRNMNRAEHRWGRAAPALLLAALLSGCAGAQSNVHALRNVPA